MKKDSRYIWYAVDIMVFLSINIFILTKYNIDPGLFFSSIQWTTLFILALGVYRLTDIITQEGVTEVIRAPFMDLVIEDGKEVWKKSKQGFRGFWATLFSCNACVGVWVSMIVFYSYLFFGIPVLVFMVIMSLTGFERFFSKLENFLSKRG